MISALTAHVSLVCALHVIDQAQPHVVVVVLVTESHPTLAFPWTVAHQAPLSMLFPRQEYWRGLSFPSPEDLPDPGIEPIFPALAAGSLPVSHQGSPRQQYCITFSNYRHK